MDAADRDKVSKIKSLWIDIGARDADDARACLACGDHPRGHAADLLRVGDGGAAELHHDRPEPSLRRRRRRDRFHLSDPGVRLTGVLLGHCEPLLEA